MEMSNALQKNLMQLFPNKIIYSAELCKNISVHMALHREAKRAGVSSRQLTESNGFVWKDIERAMDFSGEKVDEGLEVVPVINQIYTTQTFLGNAILTEEQRIAVYSYAKSAFPLAAYLQEKDFYLPIIGESGSHSIRIFDLASGKNACVYDYFVIPEFTYSLNYPIFFDEGKTVTVQTFDAHYGHREFTIYSEPGNNTIQIPGFTAMATLQLSLPVVHATLLQSDQHRNLFTLENKDLWVDDLKADSFISIDCPKGWVAKFFMGNDELVCSKSNHLYEIGNFLQMHKGTDSNANAIILIDVDSSTFDKGAMYFYVGASRARRNLEIISNATKEDCALMVRSLNPKAPLRRDPISMLKVLLSCDVDLIE